MTLRVATFNVNGIRAAQRRGFEAWLAERDPDVVALQEVRCPPAQLPAGVFGDHHLTYEPGRIAGRNGVAVLTRTRPAAVRTWSGAALLGAPDEAQHTTPAVAAQHTRVLRRAGGLRKVVSAARRGKVSFKTFVIHNFMDAEQVAPFQHRRDGLGLDRGGGGDASLGEDGGEVGGQAEAGEGGGVGRHGGVLR